MRSMAVFAFVAAALVATASSSSSSSSLYDNVHNIVAVRAAVSRTRSAWLHSERGLVVLETAATTAAPDVALWPAAFDKLAHGVALVQLGDGALPAFDVDGAMYFVRENNNNNNRNATIVLEDWVLQASATEAHRLHDNERVPLLVLHRRLAKILPRAQATAPYKITVDPGHGGSDPGAVAQGYEEQFFNLDVALRLRDLLVADSGRWSVQMTRTADVDVSLTARTNMANAWPADRFVSIHTNSFSSSSAQGTETYSYANGGTAARLRDLIQAEMIRAWGLTNRGSKTGDLHVLRETTMPATLSEMGFITSPVDIVKLRDPNARQQMAAAHLYAIRAHFGYTD